jgi:DNA-directed RNA polymerase subunit RPC12/RpoP
MHFDLELQNLRCEYCGNVQPTAENKIDGNAELPLDYMLPTSRGHMWAEAQHQLACERCGAISLLPPGETVHECPYCGSSSLFEARERLELIDPQAVGLMRVNRAAAKAAVRKWLGGGLFIPDDLTRLAKTAALRPAYYPFWTISGTLEMQWSCEVNLGSSNAPRWVPQNGYEFENFDSELVPGLKSMSAQETKEILPFNMDDVVEFRPEYLAGWTAMTYDRPLADASLVARERVVRKVRRELSNRVEIGREKRNLSTGATNWSGMTYKYLLLPLWVGTYHYRGQDYRILVNGQTGKVAGKKPVDRVKIGATAVGGFLTLLALILILLFIAFSLGWLPR